jgi:hypothetical protein
MALITMNDRKLIFNYLVDDLNIMPHKDLELHNSSLSCSILATHCNALQ